MVNRVNSVALSVLWGFHRHAGPHTPTEPLTFIRFVKTQSPPGVKTKMPVQARQTDKIQKKQAEKLPAGKERMFDLQAKVGVKSVFIRKPIQEERFVDLWSVLIK